MSSHLHILETRKFFFKIRSGLLIPGISILCNGYISYGQHEVHPNIALVNAVSEFIKNEYQIDLGSGYYSNVPDTITGYYYLYVSRADSITPAEITKSFYFFHKDSAGAADAEVKWKESGYHTLLYRTAGNSATRLNTRMLSYSPEAVVFIAFHEAFHLIFAKQNPQIPYYLNEAACDWFGISAGRDFAAKTSMVDYHKYDLLMDVLWQIALFRNAYEDSIRQRFISPGQAFTSLENRISPLLSLDILYLRDRYAYQVNNAYFLRTGYYCRYLPEIFALYEAGGRETWKTAQFLFSLPAELEPALETLRIRLD
jgi:hypothetical protein